MFVSTNNTTTHNTNLLMGASEAWYTRLLNIDHALKVGRITAAAARVAYGEVMQCLADTAAQEWTEDITESAERHMEWLYQSIRIRQRAVAPAA
jgi:hypothetical protein